MLAAAARESQEEHPRKKQSRNTVPIIQEDYFTKVSEEKIESDRKLSPEFSTTKVQFPTVPSKLYDLLMNSQDREQSGPVPETCRNCNTDNQELNEDRSQNDPRPEVGSSIYQLP